jgi:predicted thioesterase
MEGSDLLTPGLRGEVTLVVAQSDTAVDFRSGEVNVLATPRLIALCEEATMNALRGQIPVGYATVGMRVQLDHLQPTAVGGEVVAEAVLDRVEGRRLRFTVSASDRRGLVAAGKVTRVIVELAHFMDKAR